MLKAYSYVRTREFGCHVMSPDEGKSKFLVFVDGQRVREIQIVDR